MIVQEERPGLRDGFGRADVGDVRLDRVLGDGKAEFEQFAANPFGSPEPILLCHLLDQRDGLRSQFGTTTAIARFELPEEAESLTMPAEESVGFEDEQGILPVLDATREEDEPEAIGLRKGRLFYLAVQDDELLAEQRIFGDELGFTACEVGGGAENKRVTRGLGEMEKGLFKERNETNNALDRPMQGREHGVGLQGTVKNYQRILSGVPLESNLGRMGFSASTTDLRDAIERHTGTKPARSEASGVRRRQCVCVGSTDLQTHGITIRAW